MNCPIQHPSTRVDIFCIYIYGFDVCLTKRLQHKKEIKKKKKTLPVPPKQFDNVLLHMWGQKTEAKRFSYSAKHFSLSILILKYLLLYLICWRGNVSLTLHSKLFIIILKINRLCTKLIPLAKEAYLLQVDYE